MTHQALDPAFTSLLDLDAPCRQIGSGFTFTEGPIWHRGPYLGRDGRRMTDGAGVVILKANNQDEGGRWRGPGHCAILRDRDGDYIVYHAYDRQHDGAATMRIAPLVWSPDGWASAVT